MPNLINLLPSRIYDILEKTGICSHRQIIILSIWDIQKLTNLCKDDILLLKNISCNNLEPNPSTCDALLTKSNYCKKVATGCSTIDTFLNGGLRRGTITELYGESGSGKTQFAMQSAIHTWENGCLFICTEDLFPVKRYEQIKRSLPNYQHSINYGKNIFIEHITESQDLLSCVRVRIPKLLNENKLALIVIDSIAGPFRSENTNYIQRAENLRELASLLIMLAQEYQLAVLCINQVTASFDTADVLPSLGLAWSNMVTTRLQLKKTTEVMNLTNTTLHLNQMSYNVYIRELSVIFSPDLLNSTVRFIITENGISCPIK
ncbi:DNA repair protein XRCC3-like [Achroia grisella]|uniref:DNA repair protein XRCC3-like n=1 Tax=Achroia grisella TaxID=688607 RepID=UPI0027D2988B|nr:DNA repair protein XRCC3-like [Achroia grisella]